MRWRCFLCPAVGEASDMVRALADYWVHYMRRHREEC